MYSYEDIFANKNRVLFVTAHPDDLDVAFGGLLARLREDGKEAFVLVATGGARGSRENDISEAELQAMRIEEQVSALEALGLGREGFASLLYLDGEVEDNMEVIGKIAKVIRKFKPDVVCTHDPSQIYFKRGGRDSYFVNHRDHRNTGLATIDAVYPFSRDRSFFREHLEEGIEPHAVMDVLVTGSMDESNAKIDITGVKEKKRAAMLCHKSQFSQEDVERIMKMRTDDEGKTWETLHYLNLAW